MDYFLAEEGIDPYSINGYENEEWNHLSTASLISGGNADAALGIQSAAESTPFRFYSCYKRTI